MAKVTLVLKISINDLNSSLQVGDTVYYCNAINFSDNMLYNNPEDNLNKIGIVTKIYHDGQSVLIDCNMIQFVVQPTVNDFLFFSKNNEVNMASPLGYFAKAKFVNNSLIKSEMFAASCEVFESSK